MINCTNENEIYGYHSDVAYVLFGDGSVRALRDTIAPLTIVSLVTSMRGDTIDPNAL
jgi:prepilin-type processing-associated H-X9-DG protein